MPRTPLTRLERGRRYRLDDALASARGLLSAHGVDGVTMTAVAKELGVSGPALYQYFDGRPGLLRAVRDALLDDLLAVVAAETGRQGGDDLVARMSAGVHTVFTWCREHRCELDLLVGPTSQELLAASGGPQDTLAVRLGRAALPVFAALHRAGAGFRPEDEIPEPLRAQLTSYRDLLQPDRALAGEIPLGIVYTLWAGWRQIYGLLCMVAYDRLDGVFGDFEAAFADLMDGLLALIELPPAR